MKATTVYIDYAGGKFEGWFYCDGKRIGKSFYSINEVKRWAVRVTGYPQRDIKFVTTDTAAAKNSR